MSVNVRSDCICTCPVSFRLVSSCPVFSCLVLFCVTLVACFVFLCCVVSCVWRGLSMRCLLSVVCVVLCFVRVFVFVLGCLVRFHCLAVWLVCLFGFAWACVGLCVLGRGGRGGIVDEYVYVCMYICIQKDGGARLRTAAS